MWDRRDFLKFMGGGAAGIVGTPVIWQTLDDISIWSQNWGWIPRVPRNFDQTYHKTVSKISPDACGISVRCINGIPVRVSGDETNPLSLGGLSPLSACEAQLSHAPSRVRRPMRRMPDGGYKYIEWDEAYGLLLDRFKLADKNKSIMCISGDHSGTVNELLSAICSKFACPKNFYIMPGDEHTVAAAWKVLGGEGRVGYDFAKSDYILSIGADILETFGPSTAIRRSWAAKRATGRVPKQLLHYAGPVLNGTATGADEWIPIKAGTETVFLMGVIHAIFASGTMAHGFGALKLLAQDWTVDLVSRITGTPTWKIEAVARGLVSAKRPLVIAGSSTGLGGATVPVMLALLLDVMFNRLNREGGIVAIPNFNPVVYGSLNYQEMMEQNLISDVRAIIAGKKNAPETLLIYEANPLYSCAPDMMDNFMSKAGFKIAITCFFDETAKKCDLVLPQAMGLERWDDVAYLYGVDTVTYGWARPISKPQYQAKAMADVLLRACADAGLFMGYESFEGILFAKANQIGIEWKELLNTPCIKLNRFVPLKAITLPQATLAEISKTLHSVSKQEIALATVPRAVLGTAMTGIPPYATKLLERDLSEGILTARVNSPTAKRLKLKSGKEAFLKSGMHKVRVKIVVDEGVAMDTFAVTLGFGHKNFDEFNEGKGENVFSLLSPTDEPVTRFAYLDCQNLAIEKA